MIRLLIVINRAVLAEHLVIGWLSQLPMPWELDGFALDALGVCI